MALRPWMVAVAITGLGYLPLRRSVWSSLEKAGKMSRGRTKSFRIAAATD